ncbi:MAG: TRAP transporter large permease [Planctomycetes bacterium]|nr:TRAP transporter large permease [Planctomycetota bacterium]
MTIAITLILFLVLIMLSVNIGFSLIIVTLFNLLLFMSNPPRVMFHQMTRGLDNFILLSIPFFIFAGNVMNSGGITVKIFDFANRLVGWIPGGLAHANVMASIIFAGMSGSAVADAGGLGAIEMKAMKDAKFEPVFATAVTAASSTIGPIIPPSVPMVVYAVMSGESTGKLFMGGLVPGMLMGLTTMGYIYYVAVKKHYPRLNFDIGKIAYSFIQAFLPLMTPVIMIGGILLGWFTPTEAAVVACVYALVIGVIVYREVDYRKIPNLIFESFQNTAAITIITAAATGFAWLINIQGLPNRIAAALAGTDMSHFLFLLLFNIFFLILGTFMEALSVIVIVVPVLVPIMKAMNLDPVHIGVVLVLNLMIGLITPPGGMSLVVTATVGKVPRESLCRGSVPFIVPRLLVLLLITYIPRLVLWLPNVFFPGL